MFYINVKAAKKLKSVKDIYSFCLSLRLDRVEWYGCSFGFAFLFLLFFICPFLPSSLLYFHSMGCVFGNDSVKLIWVRWVVFIMCDCLFHGWLRVNMSYYVVGTCKGLGSEGPYKFLRFLSLLKNDGWYMAITRPNNKLGPRSSVQEKKFGPWITLSTNAIQVLKDVKDSDVYPIWGDRLEESLLESNSIQSIYTYNKKSDNI